MFIRKTIKKELKTGKEYFSYQLVESIRTDRGPRQRILLTIGHDVELSTEERKELANRIEELIAGIERLFPCPSHIEKLAATFAKRLVHQQAQTTPPKEKAGDTAYETVDLNSLAHEHARSCGLEHVVLSMMKTLQLDKKLRELGLTQRELDLCMGVIVARLVQPGSERSTHRWLQNTSAVDELLHTDFSRLAPKTVYRAADLLLARKKEIEEHLAKKEASLFDLDDTIVLYDLTNTYFEGSAKGISKASYGLSKEKRNDCPLVTLGLVLTKEGFPKRSTVFEGNVSEPATLKFVIEKLHITSERKPIVVLDAGIATEDNLKWIRERGYSYIVSSRTRKHEIRTDVDYKVVREKEGNIIKAACIENERTRETELHCHSTARAEKEWGIQKKSQKRFEAELNKLITGLKRKGCTKSFVKVLEKIGRLKQRYSRIARYYQINVLSDERQHCAVNIEWSFDQTSATQRFNGAYCLRVWGLNWNAERLWKTYMMLAEVEEAFRCLKSELGLRPVFHQIDRRVEGHFFISLIAYHVMHSILSQLKWKGLSIRWETLRQIMSTHMRITTVLATKEGKTVHVRASTTPEPNHREIYRVLDIPHQAGKKVRSVL